VTTAIGRRAEELVAEFLQNQGYKILGRNWRSKVCEIDIIASKGQIVYFIEVKYRQTDGQGDGLAYITPKKLKQLQFAARVWTQSAGWDGDYRLMGAAVSRDGAIEELIELE